MRGAVSDITTDSGASEGAVTDGDAPASTAGAVRGALWALHAKGAATSSPKTSEDVSVQAAAVRKAGTAGLGISRTGAAGASLTMPYGCASPARVAATSVATSEALRMVGASALTTSCGAGGATGDDLPPPQAPSASGLRAAGAVGARRSVSDTSGSNAAGATGSKWAEASNTSLHWPQRTHPSEMRNWSATTLKVVAQDGQRVIWLISNRL